MAKSLSSPIGAGYFAPMGLVVKELKQNKSTDIVFLTEL
jgi:hypothetical protein